MTQTTTLHPLRRFALVITMSVYLAAVAIWTAQLLSAYPSHVFTGSLAFLPSLSYEDVLAIRSVPRKAATLVLPQKSEEQEPTVSLHPAGSKEGELEQWELSQEYALSIPSLGIRTPVFRPSRRYWDRSEWTMLEEQMQIGLLHGATAYPHSSSPGSRGTLIIAGHSSPPDERASESAYGSLFAALPEIEIGETVSVMADGLPVTYRVIDKDIVSPVNTSVLKQQDDDSILRLITCYPVGTTTSRLIVTAERVPSPR